MSLESRKGPGSQESVVVEEAVPDVVYHKVDLGPMPVIDYEPTRTADTLVRNGSPEPDELSTAESQRRRENSVISSVSSVVKNQCVATESTESTEKEQRKPPRLCVSAVEENSPDTPDLFIEVPTG